MSCGGTVPRLNSRSEALNVAFTPFPTLCQFFLHKAITFAGARLERASLQDRHGAPATADHAGSLEAADGRRYAASGRAEQSGQEIVGNLNPVLRAAIPQ